MLKQLGIIAGVVVLLLVAAKAPVVLGNLIEDFQARRGAAIRSSCMSNIKQICLGMLMYVQDYDERFPHGQHRSVESQWYNAVYPVTAPHLLDQLQ